MIDQAQVPQQITAQGPRGLTSAQHMEALPGGLWPMGLGLDRDRRQGDLDGSREDGLQPLWAEGANGCRCPAAAAMAATAVGCGGAAAGAQSSLQHPSSPYTGRSPRSSWLADAMQLLDWPTCSADVCTRKRVGASSAQPTGGHGFIIQWFASCQALRGWIMLLD